MDTKFNVLSKADKQLILKYLVAGNFIVIKRDNVYSRIPEPEEDFSKAKKMIKNLTANPQNKLFKLVNFINLNDLKGLFGRKHLDNADFNYQNVTVNNLLVHAIRDSQIKLDLVLTKNGVALIVYRYKDAQSKAINMSLQQHPSINFIKFDSSNYKFKPNFAQHYNFMHLYHFMLKINSNLRLLYPANIMLTVKAFCKSVFWNQHTRMFDFKTDSIIRLLFDDFKGMFSNYQLRNQFINNLALLMIASFKPLLLKFGYHDFNKWSIHGGYYSEKDDRQLSLFNQDYKSENMMDINRNNKFIRQLATASDSNVFKSLPNPDGNHQEAKIKLGKYDLNSKNIRYTHINPYNAPVHNKNDFVGHYWNYYGVSSMSTVQLDIKDTNLKYWKNYNKSLNINTKDVPEIRDTASNYDLSSNFLNIFANSLKDVHRFLNNVQKYEITIKNEQIDESNVGDNPRLIYYNLLKFGPHLYELSGGVTYYKYSNLSGAAQLPSLTRFIFGHTDKPIRVYSSQPYQILFANPHDIYFHVKIAKKLAYNFGRDTLDDDSEDNSDPMSALMDCGAIMVVPWLPYYKYKSREGIKYNRPYRKFIENV